MLIFKYKIAAMYAQLFTEAGAVEAKKPVVKKEDDDSKKFGRELATLSFAMKQRDKLLEDRAAASQRAPRKVGNVTTYASLASMFGEIDNEIDATLRKTKWPRLSDHYKWKFIKEYMADVGDMNKNEKKAALVQVKAVYKTLEKVAYDMDAMKVTKLGMNAVMDDGKVFEL